MNLKESIIKDSINYKGGNFSENYFFSKLSEGFVEDYKVFGEDTAEMYAEIFGEEYTPIFESMSENVNVLNEAIENKGTALLFEQDPDAVAARKAALDASHYRQTPHIKTTKADEYWMQQNTDKSRHHGEPTKTFKADEARAIADAGHYRQGSGPNAQAAIDATNQLKNTGGSLKRTGLGGTWDSIKEWGKGLAEKFPGVSAFLGKGISWITANPLVVLGTAGGAALLTGVIRALKKRGETKKAAALQAKIDDAAKAGAKGASAVAATEKKK